MKTLYLGCAMGAAGDMLMAALYELLPDKIAFLEKMNRLLPNLSVIPEKSVKCGIQGTHMAVKYHGEEEDPHFFERHHDHDHDHDMTANTAAWRRSATVSPTWTCRRQ